LKASGGKAFGDALDGIEPMTSPYQGKIYLLRTIAMTRFIALLLQNINQLE
jgi:hypothetical protein